MQTSNFLAEYWWVLLSGAVIGLVAFLRYVKTSGGQLRVHQLLLKLPLIGDIVRKVAISRLSSTLATMLASGVQLLEALDVSRRVMSNRVLEAAVENARQNIREGKVSPHR